MEVDSAQQLPSLIQSKRWRVLNFYFASKVQHTSNARVLSNELNRVDQHWHLAGTDYNFGPDSTHITIDPGRESVSSVRKSCIVLPRALISTRQGIFVTIDPNHKRADATFLIAVGGELEANFDRFSLYCGFV